MLNKKPLTQYKEIIYYNTVDANSVEHLNLNHSICVKSLSSRRKIPMRIQSKQSFPQIEKVKNKSVNMILCGEGMKKEIQREKEANIILEQLMNLLQNNYGNGKKTKENYVRRLDKEIKDSIKSNEYRVKDTMDNLRRLQRDNDENLNKVSFIMKIAFKA